METMDVEFIDSLQTLAQTYAGLLGDLVTKLQGLTSDRTERVEDGVRVKCTHVFLYPQAVVEKWGLITQTNALSVCRSDSPRTHLQGHYALVVALFSAVSGYLYMVKEGANKCRGEVRSLLEALHSEVYKAAQIAKSEEQRQRCNIMTLVVSSLLRMR